MSLRRGAWLAAGRHEAEYGAGFKVRSIGGWGGSRRLEKLANSAATRGMDVYQWGVYTGGTMRGLARRIRVFGHLWGFDSFEGLPPELRGEPIEGRHWRPGAFSSADALGEYSLEKLLARLHEKIGYPNTTLVPGFFNVSLTARRGGRAPFPFQPALLVDVDVDLYVSTMQCLSWMIANQLLVPGSLVRYDDFRNMRQRNGEARAHRELTRAHRITWRNLGRRDLNSREWQVVAIGDPRWVEPSWL